MNTSLLYKLFIFVLHAFWTPLRTTSDPLEVVKKHAKDIVDSHFNERTVAEIITKLTPQQCVELNAQIANINGGVPLIDDKYVPYKDAEFVYKDLLFALLSDPTLVLAKYLGEFMGHKDKRLITAAMIQIADMSHFIQIYNTVQGDGFEDDRKEQESPFSNMLRVWAMGNREADAALPSEQECKDTVMKLYDEQPHWNTERDVLEAVLIKKSCSYSAQVLKAYEKRHPGDDIEDDLLHVIRNKDLVFAYQCLAGYVKNRFQLWAQLLYDFRDAGDRCAVWITIISSNRGENIKKIDDIFKKSYGGESLASYILKKKEDPVVIEILAKIVDPNHKLNIAAAPKPSAPPGSVPPL